MDQLVKKTKSNPAAASRAKRIISRGGSKSQKRDPRSREASKEDSFKDKHASTLAHTLSEILKEYGCRTWNLEKRLKIYYLNKFKNIPIIDLLSKIKLSIAIFFSRRTKQELPDGSSFSLFPHFVVRWIKRRTSFSRRNNSSTYRFCHSILQCKSVLPGPSRCHIEKIYKKHSEILGKSALQTPKFILDAAFERGKEIGKIIKEKNLYKPYETLPPSNSATYTNKRSDGGQKKLLLKTVKSDFSAFRVEPTVLFLCGKPGIGKSRIVNSICRQLCKLIETDLKDSVFTRNCNVDHWDGYQGQPIVLLDDWGQEKNSNKDLVEVISLVTENCYPLPMADLREKGTIFTSKYIILCSNIDPDSANQLRFSVANDTIRDKRALYRRLHIPIQLVDALGYNVHFRDMERHVGELSLEGSSHSDITYPNLNDRPILQNIERRKFVKWISNRVFLDQRRRQNGLLSEIPELSIDYPWSQKMVDIIHNLNLDGKHHKIDCQEYLHFPMYPNKEEPPRVRTVAVAKALGSRMVTCAEANVRVLKPFQVALWKSLSFFPQFKPTHGVDLQECFELLGERSDDEFLLSGDYESATDNLNMDFSNSILEGILFHIDHIPTKEWCRYENGKHIIEYPSWTGISPIQQETGQLMGSLLSFPLLCIANDVLTSICGIKKKMINGDDLLCYSNERQFKNWKTFGKLCGLEPSIGKNFKSLDFGTFNSQIFYEGKLLPYTNVKLVQREYQKLNFESCLSVALRSKISKRMLIRNNYKLFKKTPRSIDIPVSHGGLGISFDKKVTKIDRLCYIFDIVQKRTKNILPNNLLPEGYIWLTYPVVGSGRPILNRLFDVKDLSKNLQIFDESNILSDTENTRLLTQIQTVKSLTSEQSILPPTYINYRKLNKLKQVVIKCESIRNFINEGSLEEAVPLENIQWVTVPCRKSQYEKSYKNILNEFIRKDEDVKNTISFCIGESRETIQF